MKLVKIILTFLLISYSIVFGQGEGAVPTLAIQQSPLLLGAGWIGAAIPTNDAMGFYYNPAQLGYSSIENNLSTFIMPGNVNWLNSYNNAITFRSSAISIGYNFKKNNNDLPLTIGIGYLYNKIGNGEFIRIIGETGNFPSQYNGYDSYNCFSVGASYEYYLLFSFGFSIKPFTSTLGNPASEDFGHWTVKGTAYDIGAMVIAPFDKLFLSDETFKLSENAAISPILKTTIGYSLANLGKKIFYLDAAQSDPLTRTARLGYTINVGANLNFKNIEIPILSYSFTSEAEDILIKSNFDGSSSYQGMLGDINIGRNLIELKGDDNVTVHKGHIFNFLNTLIIASGRMNGPGRDNQKTNALGVSTQGIFELLNGQVDNDVINFISRHIVIEYYDANIFTDLQIQTNVKGIELYLKEMEL